MRRRAFLANLLFGGAALSVSALTGKLLAQTTPDPQPSPHKSPEPEPPALRGDVAPVKPEAIKTPCPPKTAGVPLPPQTPTPSPSPAKENP